MGLLKNHGVNGSWNDEQVKIILKEDERST